ncbi:NADH flavin oxidoreductase [Agrilactobacillus composti DSM 18527 = JCM 14202]|uniref:NADH flavin oxidoreductase n=1 Tax=Agrilactobacillus composti DSM 18527 = JCM 14202 TaxID=1423734 RepID=X0PHJ1_9LACO|nr:NADH-dependent flavin oxidoreductase [Agrilactobacillus composti]KRM36325.1 NADH flavin oxidoreductase [Agrilactobacillus composti DSM 18527 = JCM 14202]GAF41448.1 NADH:flavin oxidoreductase, Old Yellow Enzyme family [Agrilactobacillus composti DSM 18527 = JCM 14202]
MTAYRFLEPYTFPNKAITLKNHVVIPPMTEQMAFEDGSITQDELNYYAKHTGGVGLFITPVASVNALAKGFEGQLSIADDRFLPGLQQLARTMKANGTKAVIQISSSGRRSNSKILRGQQPVSASDVRAHEAGAEIPRALSDAEVRATIKDFGAATRRAIEAGFDGVELHGASSNLIQQFFSPHANRRTDDWGGSFEKRMRFPLAVIQEVNQVIEQYAKKPFILGYRTSAEEVSEPGITLEDTLAFVDALKQQPLDYLHISAGDAWGTSKRDKTDTRPVAKLIHDRLAGTMPLIIVGGLKTPADVEKVLDAGIELAGLGHESLREPNWVQKVQQGDEKSIRYAISPADLDELSIKPPFLDIILASSGGPEGVPLTVF